MRFNTITVFFYLLLMSPGFGQTQFNASFIKSSFNPSAHQMADITVDVPQNGKLTIYIIDRDGYPVRKLSDGKQVEAGKMTIPWDGHDDDRRVVADEAYSIWAELLVGTKRIQLSCPSSGEPFAVQDAVYNRYTGVLSYKLKSAARIHAIAASVKVDPKTKQGEGPIFKTIVNRAPRPAGSVVETWNGFDESGTVYVPDQSNFVFSIAATPLNKGSIISWGNRDRTFIDSINTRTAKPICARNVELKTDHQGLSTLQDVSPQLSLSPLNAKWNDAAKHWILDGGTLSLSCKLEGPTATAFIKLPGKIKVYVDGFKTTEAPLSSAGNALQVQIPNSSAVDHLIVVNFVSDYGPLAANTIRVKTERAEESASQ